MRVVLLLMLLVCSQIALAQSGSITLLALSESSEGAEGSTASLTLDVRPGSERVFLETVPLTKTSTQVSMRFAQQVACKELLADCTDKDFIYTIVSQPGIVGGPSAGAAASVLTASLLKGLELRKDVAITGTINSGGLIGPVGGVREKAIAAGRAGIKTLLVAVGTRVQSGNDTLYPEDIGKEANLTVIEVGTLAEAIWQFTGYNATRPSGEIVVDKEYEDRMKVVSQAICNRTGALRELAINSDPELIDEADNDSIRSRERYEEGAYYSAASFCLRANIILNEAYTENISKSQKRERIDRLEKNIEELRDEISKVELRTMTDLQAFISAEERISETEDALIDAKGNATYSALSYAEERLASARSWTAFFGLPGQSLIIDESALQSGCLQKLGEAEEGYNYVISYFPTALEETRRSLNIAHEHAAKGDYALCLGAASKAKAESNVIASAIGYEENQVDALIALKLAAARRELFFAQQQGYFPIVGYNYYQYSQDLREDDKYSSLLFAEYAVELSSMDLYFHKKKSWFALVWGSVFELGVPQILLILVLSTVVGAAAAILTLRSRMPYTQTAVRKSFKPSPTPLAKRRRGKKR